MTAGSSDNVITWETNHGDRVTVWACTLRTPLADQDRGRFVWRYRVRARNGQIVETGSEGYTRRYSAVRAALRHHPRVDPS